MPTVVGPKGQVVIEKNIRERLGIKPGAIAVQSVVGERVEIRFIPPAHAKSLFGVLAPYVRDRPQVEDWGETKRSAWEAAVNEHRGQRYRAALGSSTPKKRGKAARTRK